MNLPSDWWEEGGGEGNIVGSRPEHLQSERHLELGLVKAREYIASVRRSEVAAHVFAVIIYKIIPQ